MSKQDFIKQYGHQNFNDIKEFVTDNLMVMKYSRVIRGYSTHGKKNYITIYINKEKQVNIEYLTLFDLFTKNKFEEYIKVSAQEICDLKSATHCTDIIKTTLKYINS
jgi:hypothetical protein